MAGNLMADPWHGEEESDWIAQRIMTPPIDSELEDDGEEDVDDEAPEAILDEQIESNDLLIDAQEQQVAELMARIQDLEAAGFAVAEEPTGEQPSNTRRRRRGEWRD